MTEYLVPTKDAEAEFVEKRSRFLSHIFLVNTEEEALARLKQMRETYWDATHNVYAYIIRDGATRFSDDGEPGGTAGMPVLQVLQREGMFNILCVVTRYFGGTLLGTGGLVRAYTKAAQGALENAQVVSMISCVDVQVVMPYSLYDTALYTLEKAAAKVLSTGFTDQVTLFFRMKEGEVDPVVESLRELLAGRGELVTGDPHLDSW